MSAEQIAAALDGYRAGDWWRCRCPVHGGLSLALRDTPTSLFLRCHAGCRYQDVFAALKHLGLTGAATRRPAPPGDIEKSRETQTRKLRQRVNSALWLWHNETETAVGTIVEAYLASRGLRLPIPSTIRVSRSWWRHPEGRNRPCMVALVEHVERGAVAIHRTFLAIDGSTKAAFREPRRSLGPIGGGAVRLAPAGPELLVGEGLETCLSGMQETGAPAWAALSAGGIEQLVLPPLPLARRLIILADHDDNGRGERAAYTAARRWLAEGREPAIAMPKAVGTDWNDVLRRQEGAIR
jgi:hypothetical protein